MLAFSMKLEESNFQAGDLQQTVCLFNIVLWRIFKVGRLACIKIELKI